MKILKLEFKNLNSLYGEWTIDFTQAEYLQNGIFAITGETGSGKTTILDAICLALYGKTPRLAKITKSVNDIMTRHTGECYAKVLFETQEGRFQCDWMQHRAGKKANGSLQDPKHEIADADSKKLIETKKSLVSRVIEEKTGMDFERFTRSILLAQGGFNKFLTADIEDKSKILEQITGTEIYTNISQKVHQRNKEEKDKLKLLNAEISGIEVLKLDEEQQLKDNISAKEVEKKALEKKCSSLAENIKWLKDIEKLQLEINSLNKEEVELKQDTENFQLDRDKLDKANKATLLNVPYTTLETIRNQQKEDQQKLTTKEEDLPELESSAKKHANDLKSAEQQNKQAEQNAEDARPIINQVRVLDEQLIDKQKDINTEKNSYKQNQADINTDKTTRDTKKQSLDITQKKLENITTYFKNNEADEWLISNLTGVEQQFNNLQDIQNDIQQIESNQDAENKSLLQVEKELKKSISQCSIDAKNIAKQEEKLQNKENELSDLLDGKLLREYRTEKDTLQTEKELRLQIVNLKDHRKKLEDGKPCPLCGAEQHPFATGNIPLLDETEKQIKEIEKLIDSAEDLEEKITDFKNNIATTKEKYTTNEKKKTNITNNKENIEKTLKQLNQSLTDRTKDFNNLKSTIVDKLKPLGISEIANSNIEIILKSLQVRLDTWQTKKEKQNKINLQIQSLDKEILSIDTTISTKETALTQQQQDIENLETEYKNKSSDRKKLYANKNPETEEDKLNTAINNTKNRVKKARDLDTKKQTELTKIKTQITTLIKNIKNRKPQLQQAENNFSSKLDASVFTDEITFLEARLTQDEIDKLSARAKKLDDKKTAIQARQKDQNQKLNKEKSKKVTNETLDVLQPELNNYQQELEQNINTLAELKNKLQNNATNKEKIKDKQANIKAQQKECSRWRQLQDLIGSEDGKKFRNFAQGLTFETMIKHANSQLIKMHERYQLIRDTKQPLELNVIDSYQGDEIRSIKNLSGGESFIVSLSLALGLSKMASRKVRVDSLFLDEGFGTLDEDALTTALDALAEIQQDGKLIGVISHIAALKERISTQIEIKPIANGRSNITGPGCKKG